MVALDRWMGEVYAYIKDTPLCELPLPGSHDAISYPDIKARSQTQSLTIVEQLQAGYRYFDFRVKVNNGVYYGVHGGDNTEHDYVGVNGAGHKPYVFDQIADFLRAPGHEKELVILSFSHFDAHGGQRFNPTDAQNFARLIASHFGRTSAVAGASMLVPRKLGPTATYGRCVDDTSGARQVVVIIEDDANWYKDPAGTPNGDAERANALFFSQAESVLDCYSDIYLDLNGGAAFNDVTAKITTTLADQEAKIRQLRDLGKFWISQAVLNYAITLYDGKSQNYTGAKEMNPRFAHIYEYAWRNGFDSQGAAGFPKPNILLLDFVGALDHFPEACVRTVSPPQSWPMLQSGTRYLLLNNLYGNHVAAPQEYNGYFYAFTNPQDARTHKIVRKAGAGPILSGDEVYLLALVGGGDAYLRTNTAASNDLWYEAGDKPQTAHTWSIIKPGAAKGSPIHERDVVLIQSMDKSSYMCPRGGYDYVSLTDDKITWMIEEA